MREAINKGQQRAKELKHDYEKRSGMSIATAISSSNATFVSNSAIERSILIPELDSTKMVRSSTSKALKLGSKGISDEAFVEKSRNEGQIVADMKKITVHTALEENLNHEAVLVKLTEKLIVIVSRNGGVEFADVIGALSINVNDTTCATTALKITTNLEK